jgi:hypothetical protein
VLTSTIILVTGLALGAGATAPVAPDFEPGASGVGDPYFPLDGNGGYDVRHYRLDVTYNPGTDRLDGVVRIRARATQNLSHFNLDLDGLTVQRIRVRGSGATWDRAQGELTVHPKNGIRNGSVFRTVIAYGGVPQTIDEPGVGLSGFLHTDDGAVVVGEPHVAATWFPVNDHPTDKASYTFRVRVPAGLEAVANGALQGKRTVGSWTTWKWRAAEPMAPYLATIQVGRFALDKYRVGGIRYWDAIDPDLFEGIGQPYSGTQFAWSDMTEFDQTSYKRLSRSISVPVAGATLDFWVNRHTEQDWDFMFVEARTAGQQDWTTLPDLNGHTNQELGFSCPFWHSLHPFLAHYQTDNGDGTCSPTGSTGTWNAASGRSDGYEQWSVDLSPYAGKDAVVAISYASDDFVQGAGVVVDDVEVSTGAGSTSFEDDGDTFDGWTVIGAPPGSPPNPNDWVVATAADGPPSTGDHVTASLERQPEILDFLSDVFGRYPFSTSGGIVDDTQEIGFALETQTRPFYSPGFFEFGENTGVVVHELAHQWYGDSLAVARWKEIWLNEGFASYAEWLWEDEQGFATPQEIFDFFYGEIPADDPFWDLTIGDPGVEQLFDGAVYIRGAMTLQALRGEIGDADFLRILRRWATLNAGGNVSTEQFIRLAEDISGEQLDSLFDEWLYTTGKPTVHIPELARTATLPAEAIPPTTRPWFVGWLRHQR